MNILFYLVDRLSELVTVILHAFFLYRTLETNRSAKAQTLANAIYVCIRMAYFISGLEYRPYFAVISGVVYAAFVFIGGFKAFTVWTIILVGLDGIVDAAIISLYLLLPNTVATQIGELNTIRIVVIFAAKLTLFIVYYFVTNKVDKSHVIQWHDCMALLIVPIGCWVMLEILFRYMDTITDSVVDPLLSIGSIVLLFIMVSVVKLYNRTTVDGKELTQSKLQLHAAKMTQEHINQINEVYTKLATLRHDLMGHFTAIAGYIKTKEYGALEEYIREISYSDIGDSEYTKHPVLNALVSSKVAVAEKLNISFSMQMEVPEELPISDVDLCILLNNILDNAFEANERAAEPRYINLHTHVVNSYWVVACRNATREQRRFRGMGSLKSTKGAIGIHGIGTKQIQRIAESSGGFVTYRYENYEFTTLAMIKLPA